MDAPAGTFVFARPGVTRTAFAEEPGTTILAIGATPGKVYEPTGFELLPRFLALSGHEELRPLLGRPQEIIHARVWGGIHFRTTDVQGAVLGKKVADYMTKHYFQPTG